MRVLLTTAAVFALTLGACAAPPPEQGVGPTKEPAESRPPAAAKAALVPLDKKKFGEAITEQATTPLPAIVKDPSQFTNKMVRTEGTVSAVCQAMGCWMQIKDDTGKAHIKMAGHSFFVPKQSSGHHAVVQGKVTGSDQPNSCAAGDGCGNQEVTQVQIEATGVEFID